MFKIVGLQQPMLGMAATAMTIILALSFCGLFSPDVFGSWVAQISMSAIPMQMVMGMVWKSSYPSFLNTLPQPAKGLAIAGILGLSSAVVTPLILMLNNGGLGAPTPFAIMFTIVSIGMTLWVVLFFQSWPVTLIAKSPGATGIGVWVFSYVLTWAVFHTFFDFGAMKAAPFYSGALDPRGLFDAWNALSFIVTAVLVMMFFVVLDFWPVTLLAGAVPVLGRQPFFGIVSSVLAMIAAGVLWAGAIVGAGMDVVNYLVRIPVAGLFGVFIMLVMMQTAPFQKVRQPLKGVLLLVVVGFLAAALYKAYSISSGFLVGPLPNEAPSHALDIWIATAMLSVTFPLFIIVGDSLAFWPLARTRAEKGD